MNRRHYLALCAGSLVGLAGCGGEPDESASPTISPTATQTGSPTPETRQEPTDPSTATPTPVEDTVDPGELPSPLAVDSSNPIIYINDIPLDNFNGELALAMASDSDGIDLQGYLHEFPRPSWWDSNERFEQAKSLYREHHQLTRQKAAQSGFTGLPPAEFGLYERHEKPESGEIADTSAVGSTATDTIVEAARAASRQNPLVVASGGPLCTIADAYLRDPSIAESVVVFWRGKPPLNEGWNGEVSGWSATVVLQALRTVLCPANGSPNISRKRVKRTFPDTPLKRYMLTKVYDGTGKNPLNGGNKWAADAVTTLSAAHPETRETAENLQVTGTQSHWQLGPVFPALSDTSSDTHIKIIRQHLHGEMNAAWWGHMGDPSTWDGE